MFHPESKRAKSSNATMSVPMYFSFDRSHGEAYCLSPIDWVGRLPLVIAIKLRAAINDKSLHTSWTP